VKQAMAKTTNWKDAARLEDALLAGLKIEEFQSISKALGRPINILEMGICAALYSEHCSYKSSKVHLKTLPTAGKRVLQGPGENAGVIDIGDNQAVVFKIESHNHPSYIEPFQGAATGVGGILRDVFTMGARPIALLNSLRFGALDHPKTKYLTKRSVAGIGGYGNCMGVPTIGGELFFHEAYNGNCLVNAFALGIVEHDKIFYGKASGIGNKVFYVGSKTGRDGIHGATMASEEFGEGSEEKRPTVQVGDPFQEKLLLEACLEVMASGAVIGIQDMGAAGMTSSCYEMAERAGTGVVIHLDRVPMRETEMNPYEIMLSESQERMLLVVEKGREAEVFPIVQRWGLDAVEIGEVVAGDEVTLMWHAEVASRMPVHVVTAHVPQYKWPFEAPADFQETSSLDVRTIVKEPNDLNAAWFKLLGSINIASRRPVFSQYDSTVRTNTVVHPGGDAAVIRIKRKSAPEKGVAISLDCNSRYCQIDPHKGTVLSVAESIRNITAVGAEAIGISNCLNFGNPEKPNSMWQLAESIRGLGEAAKNFEAPVVSGNVSLYNETQSAPILPTPQIAMVGLIADVTKCVKAQFSREGDAVFVIGETLESDMGGSEYAAQIHNIEKGRLPAFDYALEKKTNKLIRDLINDRLLNSCHDVSQGGLAVALAECCFSDFGRVGAVIDVEKYQGRKDALLFAESSARYIVSCNRENAAKVRARCEREGIVISLSGVTGGKNMEIRGIAALDLEKGYTVWADGLEQAVWN
jgi:phosphoribosylformylglycinamidine synthase II